MRSRRTTALVGALGLAAVSLAARAHADDANVCSESYEGAQTLMKPGQSESKLLPAREALRTCMRSGCKDWMVSDCSRWLGEVESRIPTVVFSAKNTAGRDLGDVHVARDDGEELAASIDGRAREMEPGSHRFVFTASDGTRREKQALVREGEKAQNVSVLFDAPPEERASVGLGSETTAPRPGHKGTSALPYVGYGVVGAGVVGLGIGTIFGLTAIAKKDTASCDASGACAAGPLADATSAARVSTVAFVAGGVLLAGGLALILFAPSARSRAAVASLSSGYRW